MTSVSILFLKDDGSGREVGGVALGYTHTLTGQQAFPLLLVFVMRC